MQVDLVAPQRARAWAAHLRAAYPGIRAVVGFSSKGVDGKVPMEAPLWRGCGGGGEGSGEWETFPVGKEALLAACHSVGAADGPRQQTDPLECGALVTPLQFRSFGRLCVPFS